MNADGERSLFERVLDWLDGRSEPPRQLPRPRSGDGRDAAPLPIPSAQPAVAVAAAPIPIAPAGGPQEEPLELLQTSIVRGVTGGSTRAITEAFNASQPVGDRYELSGRIGELNRLVKSVIDGWQHAVIYGARGVGKTSLARVFGDLTDEAGCDVFYQSASGDAEFEEVVRPYLRFIGESAGRIGGRPAVESLGERFGARDVADALSVVGQRRVFLILDEFDRITNARARTELAALLKLLSDFRVGVQFVIVGISTDVDNLIEEHPSLRRHMIAIRVGPIAPEAIAQLLEEGARRAQLRFDAPVVDAITALSLGSPYHARIFALGAALETADKGQDLVDEPALQEGLNAVWTDWAGVSPGASRLFARLSGRTELHDVLAAVAIIASSEYGFTERRIADALTDLGVADPVAATRDGIDALRDELRETDGRLVFRDSLAPEFLLLALVRRDKRGSQAGLGQLTARYRDMADRLSGQMATAGEL